MDGFDVFRLIAFVFYVSRAIIIYREKYLVFLNVVCGLLTIVRSTRSRSSFFEYPKRVFMIILMCYMLLYVNRT